MKPFLLALFVLLTHSLSPLAGENLTLTGKITDLNNQPIALAQVVLKNAGDTTFTDSSGQFHLSLKPDSLNNPGNPKSLFEVVDQGVRFFVVRTHEPVRIQVLDESGKNIATVLDSTLSRGRFFINPLATLFQHLQQGVFNVQFEIGKATYHHRIPFSKKKTRPGLFPELVSLNEIAKALNTEVDTLVVSKSGHRTDLLPVLRVADSLTDKILFAEKITPWLTDDLPYLKPIGSGVEILPLLTVGESVPMTGDSTRAFRMGGIPDGMGIRAINKDFAQLFMNHEIASYESIHAEIPGTSHQGAYVSEFKLNRKTSQILSGKMAYHPIHLGGWGSEIQVKFGRFCSGFLGGPAEGLTQPIYLTGEETKEDSLTFSKKGGHAVAITDNQAYVLPDFGKMTFENIVVVPTPNPKQTIAFVLEDGPSHASQLYMYVGEKTDSARVNHVLLRNGLLGGKLFTFSTTGKRDEGDFTSGTLQGHWVEPLKGRPNVIQGLAEVSREDLDRWSQVSVDGQDSSFNFDRIEDGVYDKKVKGVFYFATTGDPKSNRNRFGRIYKLTFDPLHPLSTEKPPRLEMVMAGDSASGFVSPDNLDLDVEGNLMVCEDFNLSMPRLPALWMLNVYNKNKGLRKIAEMNVASVPLKDRPDPQSEWETTGVIDASSVLGKGKWLVNVQAHSILGASAASMQSLPAGQSLVQGGQLIQVTVKP